MNAHISDDKTVGTAAAMTAAAQELGATTTTRANEAATVVGEKIGSLATAVIAVAICGIGTSET